MQLASIAREEDDLRWEHGSPSKLDGRGSRHSRRSLSRRTSYSSPSSGSYRYRRRRTRSPLRRRSRSYKRKGSSSGDYSPQRSFEGCATGAKTYTSPCIRDLDVARINRSLKVPVLEIYDGTGDPFDQTYSYERLMHFHGHNAVKKCHLFISTLKKIAREWMVSLPSRSIGSWEELKEQFHTRFSSNKKCGKRMTSFIQVRQKPNETLRQYMKRFKEAVAKIPSLDPVQAIQFLKLGLNIDKSTRLIEEIISKAPQNLTEAYDKDENFIEMEEALAGLRGSSRHTEDYPPKQDHKGMDSKENDRRGYSNDRRPKDEIPKDKGGKSKYSDSTNKDYTPLNTSRAKIVKNIKDEPFFERPRKIKVSLGRKRTVNISFTMKRRVTI